MMHYKYLFFHQLLLYGKKQEIVKFILKQDDLHDFYYLKLHQIMDQKILRFTLKNHLMMVAHSNRMIEYLL